MGIDDVLDFFEIDRQTDMTNPQNNCYKVLSTIAKGVGVILVIY